jgi:biopolymer transport protein ExbD/biopolymer transport protein TolR
MAAQRNPKVIAEINITPLTDIFLVLLIIMMVVTPMLDFTGLAAVLGDSDSAEAATPSEEKVLAVEITAEGPYRVGEEDVAPEELAGKLRTEAPMHAAGLAIEVDPTAPLERLTRVMDLCQELGILKASIDLTTPAAAESRESR